MAPRSTSIRSGREKLRTSMSGNRVSVIRSRPPVTGQDQTSRGKAGASCSAKSLVPSRLQRRPPATPAPRVTTRARPAGVQRPRSSRSSRDRWIRRLPRSASIQATSSSPAALPAGRNRGSARSRSLASSTYGSPLPSAPAKTTASNPPSGHRGSQEAPLAQASPSPSGVQAGSPRTGRSLPAVRTRGSLPAPRARTARSRRAPDAKV